MAELSDTDPHAREVWLGLLRSMPPNDRMAQALHLTALAMRVSEAGVRASHPDSDDREVFLLAAARRLSRGEMIAAYGWDADAHAG